MRQYDGWIGGHGALRAPAISMPYTAFGVEGGSPIVRVTIDHARGVAPAAGDCRTTGTCARAPVGNTFATSSRTQ